jgi:hypothetical protein
MTSTIRRVENGWIVTVRLDVFTSEYVCPTWEDVIKLLTEKHFKANGSPMR